MKDPIELQLVDLIVDKCGEKTMDEMCQPGIREEIAEELAGPIKKILDGADAKWVRDHQERVQRSLDWMKMKQ